MLTLAEAREYLAALGLTLPDAVLQLLVDRANSADTCLALHYTPETAALIRLQVIALLGLASGDRYVSSQSAPSGASQSFRFHDLRDRWRLTLGMLRSLDTERCMADLIPPDPTTTAHAGIWAAPGQCWQE